MSRLKKPIENETIDVTTNNIFKKVVHRHSMSNPNSTDPMANGLHQSRLKIANILTKQLVYNRESPYAKSQSNLKTFSKSNVLKKKEKAKMKLKTASTLNSSSYVLRNSIKSNTQEIKHETSFPNYSFNDDSKLQNKAKSKDMNLSVTNHINLVDQNNTRDPLLEFSRQGQVVQTLEIKLTKLLRETQKPTAKMPKEVFDVYSKIFDEIIDKDTIFGPLLFKIQHAYEDWLAANKNESKEITKNLKIEISDITKKFQTQTEDKKTMDRKIEKLSKENYELSKSLEEQESRYLDLQEKFYKIASVKTDSFPRDENS